VDKLTCVMLFAVLLASPTLLESNILFVRMERLPFCLSGKPMVSFSRETLGLGVKPLNTVVIL
jgi:hypothetical protein